MYYGETEVLVNIFMFCVLRCTTHVFFFVNTCKIDLKTNIYET
jgi:hypothetical protein